jgi:hypothetical protein
MILWPGMAHLLFPVTEKHFILLQTVPVVQVELTCTERILTHQDVSASL